MVNQHCMCQGIGESVDHLLIHCDAANALWGDVFRNLGFIGLCWGMMLLRYLAGEIG